MTREEVIDRLKEARAGHKEFLSIETLNMAIKALEQEPKTGYWIDNMDLGYHVSICSNCDWRGHGDTNLIYKPKYCPNCGARMVEPQ